VKNDVAEMPDDAGVLEIQHTAAGDFNLAIRLLPEMAAGQCHLVYRLESRSRKIGLSLVGPAIRSLNQDPASSNASASQTN
jgi:hypothetical protein